VRKLVGGRMVQLPKALPLALAFQLLTSRAGAAELAWSAPAECPDHTDVAREVGRLVGEPLEAADRADFAVEIVRSGAGFELTLRRTERDSGERASRKLRGKTCSDVTDAAAVAIAMAIQGDDASAQGVEWQTEPREATPLPEPVAPSTSRMARDRGTRSAPEPSPFYALGAVGGVVDFGALPDAAPGVELDVSGGYRKVRLTALAALFAPVSAPASAGGGGEFRFWVVGMLSCFEQPLRGYALAACAGFELGRMRGQGEGVTTPRERSAHWEAARLEAGVSLPAAGAFAVGIRAGAVFPFYRPEFVLDGTELVHRAAPVTGRALVAIEFRP